MMVIFFSYLPRCKMTQSPDPDADYTIFVWRQQQTTFESDSLPTLHLQDPSEPLPIPPAYQNPAFYVFQPSRSHTNQSHSTSSSPYPRSPKSRRSKQSGTLKDGDSDDGSPAFKKAFEKFHSENGVRTVIGSIGPVNNGNEIYFTFLIAAFIYL